MTQFYEPSEHIDGRTAPERMPAAPALGRDVLDVLPVLAGLQEQIDQLTAAVESQQSQIKRLRRLINGLRW